jgi:thymidylate synthase
LKVVIQQDWCVQVLSILITSLQSIRIQLLAAELVWYFAGDRGIEYITRYAKFWEHIASLDPETKKPVVNSAYGDLIFRKKNQYDYSQYHWAFESLANDKDTRQAIMHFNMPLHQYEGNKDFVCTLHGMFMIRDNKLNLTVSMRSNDAILGTPTDIPFFCTLQRHMFYHLKPLYPELELGTYKHQVHSMHVYERHFDLINEMLEHQFKAESLPDIDKAFINMDGSPTQITKNLFEWANDDVRDPIIGMTQDPFVDFITSNLVTTNNLVTDGKEEEN